MRKKIILGFVLLIILLSTACVWKIGTDLDGNSSVIDHNQANMNRISESDVRRAVEKLSILYGHTSHGSQLTTGMTGLVDFANSGNLAGRFRNSMLAYSPSGENSTLRLREISPDAGYFPTWRDTTVSYLDNPNYSHINVVIWAWCGQLSHYDSNELMNTYLLPMEGLENQYPNVFFVYMTGHADGTGLTGNLHLRNEEIRQWCRTKNKLLYDFNDIENYDPDGNYYGDKFVDDECYYTLAGQTRNWAREWQTANPGKWFDCASAHSEPVNANLKAYAAWSLWTHIAKSMR